MAPTYIGDFYQCGKELRLNGINRIGNLFVPNDNYCLFEDWVMPKLDAMLKEQQLQKKIWTPSKLIARLGKEINNENSVLYWAYVNKIPIFCPALTDGSLGDMIYMHSFKNPGLIIDVVQDLRRINSMSLKARKTGMIILGGGVVKHHICNANLMVNLEQLFAKCNFFLFLILNREMVPSIPFLSILVKNLMVLIRVPGRMRHSPGVKLN